jgi:hypothetical protein
MPRHPLGLRLQPLTCIVMHGGCLRKCASTNPFSWPVCLVPSLDHKAPMTDHQTAAMVLTTRAPTAPSPRLSAPSAPNPRRVVQDSLRYYGEVAEMRSYDNASPSSSAHPATADLVDSYWDFEAPLKSAFVARHSGPRIAIRQNRSFSSLFSKLDQRRCVTNTFTMKKQNG